MSTAQPLAGRRPLPLSSFRGFTVTSKPLLGLWSGRLVSSLKFRPAVGAMGGGATDAFLAMGAPEYLGWV